MKKTFIIIMIFLTIYFSATIKLNSWPFVIDTKRVASWVAGNLLIVERWLYKIKHFKDGSHVWGILKASGLIDSNIVKGIKGLTEFEIDEYDTDEWKQIIDQIINTDYFGDITLWEEIYNKIDIKEKYPALAPDYVNRLENNIYYKENTEYREYIDENKRIYNEEMLKDLENKIDILSSYKKLKKDRAIIYKKLKEDLDEAGTNEDGAAKQGKLLSLNTLMNIYIVERKNEILSLVAIFLESNLKKEVWKLDRKNRYLKLNEDNSKNIENIFKMGEN